jgi:MinD superfamily P-loop ATPase
MLHLSRRDPLRELVVISGKGGTGKTSIVASFVALAKNAAVADCDVDAADLHLVLEPKIRRRQVFTGGKKARIKPGHCTACGKCEELCRFDAIFFDGPGNGRVSRTYRIDPVACEGCGVCVRFCTENAIEFASAIDGEWFVSDTRCGPMVHAQLNPGAGNSGKLVTIVRSEAQRIAKERGSRLVLVDGSPGIGCPVIASITGASLVLVVTEPTLSGEHDMGRVLLLARHFGIPTAVCVNKWDLNANIAQRIERQASAAGSLILPRVPYDPAITEAQRKGLTVVELGNTPAAQAIQQGWSVLCPQLS